VAHAYVPIWRGACASERVVMCAHSVRSAGGRIGVSRGERRLVGVPKAQEELLYLTSLPPLYGFRRHWTGVVWREAGNYGPGGTFEPRYIVRLLPAVPTAPQPLG
jgi:hypothetical protein